MRRALFAIFLPTLAAGCTTDTVLRPEGVTSYAGEAIAANTAMQIVDPWPYGVQDTRLRVPADRPSRSATNAAAPAARTHP